MDQKQIQNLLQYLGFYRGQVDGITGPLTRQAVMDFQSQWGLEPDGEAGEQTQLALRQAVWEGLPEKTGDFWSRIRYWNREEFRCRCGQYHSPYCDGFPAEPSQTLVELLDDIRAHFGRPAIPSSGLRCPQHNRDSGGVENSRHLTGRAMDFTIPGIPAETVRAYAAADPRCSYTYVIEGSYVHVDVQ